MSAPPLVVVAAAVIERDDAFLVTRRQQGVHLEGFWEFPGGKCEAAESHASCLARELREELDVDAIIGEPLLATVHHYADRSIELHFFRCELRGAPVPQQGQAMQWIARADLQTLRFPPADVELIRMLCGRAPTA